MQTIFIQETDDSIREILTLILQSEGYQVTATASSGAEILRIISRQKPCLVLIDFMISGERAIKTCRMIKQYWKSLPILAMSCNTNIKEVYKNFGFDGYIEKPFDITVLAHMVRKFKSPAIPQAHRHPDPFMD